MSSKKYQSKVSQEGGTWVAYITRQITSRKSIVSKKQDGFSSEAEAQTWVDSNLSEFINTQKKANSRQGTHRKDQDEIKRQRSSRRAQKTDFAKREKAAADIEQKALSKQQHDISSESKPEFD